MERFIDRSAEMETLQSEYERNGSALVVLYGRRRVGKSTLISKFIKDKPALLFGPVKNQRHKTGWPLGIKRRSLSTVTCCEMRM